MKPGSIVTLPNRPEAMGIILSDTHVIWENQDRPHEYFKGNAIQAVSDIFCEIFKEKENEQF